MLLLSTQDDISYRERLAYYRQHGFTETSLSDPHWFVRLHAHINLNRLQHGLTDENSNIRFIINKILEGKNSIDTILNQYGLH